MALLRQSGRTALSLAAILAMGCVVGAPALIAQAATPAEYQLKAVFLFNFTQFVEWPTGAFAGPQEPFVIGVLGGNPFGGYLDETVHDEKINGHRFEIRRYRSVAEIGTCHVLFISGSEAGRLREILPRLPNRNVLTVGDAEGFAAAGGIIQFYTESNRIKLRVNIDAAKAAGLTISSKLLRSADVISKRSD
jgi:hypothetical protein